ETIQQLSNVAFDNVFHLASPASPVQYIKYPLETLRLNTEGTRLLLEYVKENPATKILFASTSEVYGDPLEHPQKETYWGNVNSFGPRSCYDEAKRFGEALCYSYQHLFNLDIRIVRIFNTYGPNMEQNDGRVISNFITQALSKKPITIYGDGTQTRSFCYVTDLVDGLISMMQADTKGMVINLGNPQEESMIDMARKIKELTSSSSEITYHDLPEDDPKRRRPDVTKAQKYLNWNPKIQLEEGLLKTITYFKERFSL
ncbi:MAG: GDP-mannose 4,6-dehydratase, partial [Patescibacteria group bacterium]